MHLISAVAMATDNITIAAASHNTMPSTTIVVSHKGAAPYMKTEQWDNENNADSFLTQI